jgi:hypothetical protein
MTIHEDSLVFVPYSRSRSLGPECLAYGKDGPLPSIDSPSIRQADRRIPMILFRSLTAARKKRMRFRDTV